MNYYIKIGCSLFSGAFFVGPYDSRVRARLEADQVLVAGGMRYFNCIERMPYSARDLLDLRQQAARRQEIDQGKEKVEDGSP